MLLLVLQQVKSYLLDAATSNLVTRVDVGYLLLGILTISVAVNFALFGWWAVGTWRSAAERKKKPQKSIWPVAAKAAILLFVLCGALLTAQEVTPVALDVFSELSDDPQLGASSVKFNSTENAIEIDGPITRSVSTKFDRLLTTHLSTSVVLLDSLGGREGAARNVRDMVRGKRLDTLVINNCSSACTIIFLGGERRFISQRARLGFHVGLLFGELLDGGGSALRADARNEGISSWFIAKAYDPGRVELWYPTPSELVAAHVATKIVSSENDIEAIESIKK